MKNAIRIVAAAIRAGIDAQLWTVRNAGDLLAEAHTVPVRALRDGPARLPRPVDLAFTRRSLTRTIDEAAPNVLLSAGNHIHPLAARALAASAMRGRTRLVLRASNAGAHVLPGWPGIGRIRERLLTWKYARADAIVAVSSELAGILFAVPALRPIPIYHVANGVDREILVRRGDRPLDDPWFMPGAPPVILGVGRLSRQKGFDLLIRAFAHAAGDRPLRLVIVGPGNPGPLQRQAAGLGVADRVRLLGFQPNPYRYIARAALVAISSRWEGSSNVVLEALALGTPVVAAACPTGIREVVAPLGEALLVPPEDPVALADAMLDRLDRPRDGDRLRARAEAFALDETLSRYVAILRREIRTSRRERTPEPFRHLVDA